MPVGVSFCRNLDAASLSNRQSSLIKAAFWVPVGSGKRQIMGFGGTAEVRAGSPSLGVAVTDLCRNFFAEYGLKPRFYRDFEARV